jgi:hypothetical protein
MCKLETITNGKEVYVKIGKLNLLHAFTNNIDTKAMEDRNL